MRLDPLLEFMAFWEGGVSADRLAEAVGMSREHVQRSIVGPYRERYPTALKARRIEFAEGAACLRHAPSSVAGVLSVLRAMQAIEEASGTASPLRLRLVSLPEPTAPGEVKTEHFAKLTAAMVRREALRMDYVAKRGVQQFRFSPHQIVDAPFRPHIRGYASHSDGGLFMDLVPSRIASIHGSSTEHFVDASQDREWFELINLHFAINPDITPSVRETIIEEMDGQTELEVSDVRRALERYVVRSVEGRRVEGIDIPLWRHSSID